MLPVLRAEAPRRECLCFGGDVAPRYVLAICDRGFCLMLKLPRQPERCLSHCTEDRHYRPIAEYAAIGDCHGHALVGMDGGIDWCAFGRFDADPVLCRLLDRSAGGFVATRPVEACWASRRYLPGTNVLRTEFATETGTFALTDFMAVGRDPAAGIFDYVSLRAPGWLVRRIEGISGEIELDFASRLSIDFARRSARLRPGVAGVTADGGFYLRTDIPLTVEGYQARGRLFVREGDSYFVVLSSSAVSLDRTDIEDVLATTTRFWQEWIGFCRYDGKYSDQVRRSALALKLMSYAPTGAIVAAPTTSLPETIGGERNWDYRFCWVRDASFALYALAALGYSGEAKRFFAFLQQSCEKTHPEVQLMYGIAGERDLPERRLDHLDGYCGSRPVRVGNAAVEQRQLDIYGYVLDAALLYVRLGGRLPRQSEAMLAGFVDLVARYWSEPDSGLWEVRSAPLHFTHSRLMCWVAVDRAIRLMGPRPQWLELRAAIAASILGNRAGGGGLPRAAEDRRPDAALLLVPLMDFPVSSSAIVDTVKQIEAQLRSGDFVHRYVAEDGLAGGEGAFLLCSFWLVDALLTLDREAEARDLFERLLARANDVGLYSEEIDTKTGDFLGNFPQALTHLGLIGSAVNLRLYETGGAAAVRGTYADRAARSVGASFGWRGILSALRHSGTLPLRSSRASKLGLGEGIKRSPL
jgi:alpha,alpha-trehalase